jgi:hypothetical protein
LGRKSTLFDDFEYSGHWWLPEDPEKKVAGTVRFNSDGYITLDLLESFNEPPGTVVDGLFRPKLILGLTDGRKRITLYQTVRTGRTLPSMNPAFSANYLLVGGHFLSRSDIRFSSLSANFTYFEEWMGHATFEPRVPSEDKVVAGYSEPEEIEVGVRAIDALIRIHSDSKKGGGDWLRSLEWEHTGLLTIIPQESRDLAWYREVLDSLQDLMTLLVGKPVFPKTVYAWAHRDEFTLGVFPNAGPVELFFNQPFRTLPPPRRSHHVTMITEDVLLPLPSIVSDLPKIFNSWFRTAEAFGPVYDLFLGALYNTKAYPQSEFLSLMQALESYHRRTRRGKYVRDEEYEEYRRAIVSGIPGVVPKGLKDSLKKRLEYGNEYSLRKRLKELITPFPEKLILKANPNFINEVVDTRNYLTHYTDELKEKALHGPRLLKANEDLRALLTSLLYRRLGVDPGIAYGAYSKLGRSTYFSLEE